MENIKKFETGKSYRVHVRGCTPRSALFATITSRSNNFITFECQGTIYKRKVTICCGVERANMTSKPYAPMILAVNH